MTTCPYCTKPATATIIATPSRVCSDHALEFWIGLLDYARGRTGPCVKHETLCGCVACEELGISQLRAAALLGAEASPGDHVGFVMPLAS
jgi:hypothetical protein